MAEVWRARLRRLSGEERSRVKEDAVAAMMPTAVEFVKAMET